jgi:hypothetical protein
VDLLIPRKSGGECLSSKRFAARIIAQTAYTQGSSSAIAATPVHFGTALPQL